LGSFFCLKNRTEPAGFFKNLIGLIGFFLRFGFFDYFFSSFLGLIGFPVFLLIPKGNISLQGPPHPSVHKKTFPCPQKTTKNKISISLQGHPSNIGAHPTPQCAKKHFLAHKKPQKTK
jgi:hypothetical protein